MFRRWLDLTRDHGGTAAIELALVLPALLLVVLGGAQFGLALNQYVTLTNGVAVATQQFADSRGDSQPVTDALTAITNAAPTLTVASLTVTMSVNNATACFGPAAASSSPTAGNTACSSQLTSAAPAGGVLTPASVTATYPCGPQFTWISFWPSTCVLSFTSTEGVQ